LLLSFPNEDSPWTIPFAQPAQATGFSCPHLPEKGIPPERVNSSPIYGFDYTKNQIKILINDEINMGQNILISLWMEQINLASLKILQDSRI